MKVLHIEGGKYLYGGAYQVFHLLRLLKGHGEHILACPFDSAIAAEALKAGIEVLPIPLNGEGSFKAYFVLREIIRETSPDIVHVHSRRGADLWGVLAANRSHTPLVITRRVDNPEPRWLARVRYGKAVRVVGISQKICDVLQSEGVDTDKLLRIRSGVDTTAFKPRSGKDYIKAQFGISPDEKVVVMAAQCIPRKGHATLLDAIPSILSNHPQTRFLLLGQGGLLEDIRTKATQFGDRVIVPGFRRDFAQILPECDIMVHPAEMEGLGVVILQAAACGVPVVTTKAGGIPEIVEDERSGYLIEPKDPAALAQKVNLLLDDAKLRYSMSEFSREYALRELSIDTTAASNFAMYEAIMNEKHSAK